MDIQTILKVLKTERECIARQGDISKCDRRCGECDLCLPDEEILSVYDFLIEGYESLEKPTPLSIRLDTSKLSQEEYQNLVDKLKGTNFGKIEAIGKDYD